jgi:hypothetical protein
VLKCHPASNCLTFQTEMSNDKNRPLKNTKKTATPSVSMLLVLSCAAVEMEDRCWHRKQPHNSAWTKLGMTIGRLNEFGRTNGVKPGHSRNLLAHWSEDPATPAKPLNLEEDLPSLQEEVAFSTDVFLEPCKVHVEVWTKLLVTIGIVGRKSNLCGDCCPKFEDLATNPNQSTVFWDSERGNTSRGDSSSSKGKSAMLDSAHIPKISCVALLAGCSNIDACNSRGKLLLVLLCLENARKNFG